MAFGRRMKHSHRSKGVMEDTLLTLASLPLLRVLGLTRSFSHKQTHATPAPSPFVLFVWRVKGGRKSSSIKLCNGGQDTTPPPHHTPCFLSQRFPKNHNLGYPRTLHSPVCLVSSCVLCGGRGMCACVRLCGWNGNCAAATS